MNLDIFKFSCIHCKKFHHKCARKEELHHEPSMNLLHESNTNNSNKSFFEEFNKTFQARVLDDPK